MVHASNVAQRAQAGRVGVIGCADDGHAQPTSAGAASCSLAAAPALLAAFVCALTCRQGGMCRQGEWWGARNACDQQIGS
jgi:hypothetical protein